MKQKPSDHQARYLPLGMCLGISIGTAIGVASNHLPVYMAVGLSIGLCIGSLLDAKNRKATADNNDAAPEKPEKDESKESQPEEYQLSSTKQKHPIRVLMPFQRSCHLSL